MVVAHCMSQHAINDYAKQNNENIIEVKKKIIIFNE